MQKAHCEGDCQFGEKNFLSILQLNFHGGKVSGVGMRRRENQGVLDCLNIKIR